MPSYKINPLASALEEQNEFDIFIQSTSAEERSLQALRILQKLRILPKQNLLFLFKEVVSTMDASKADSFVANYSFKNTEPLRFECWLLDVENGVRSFYEWCLTNEILIHGKRILFNISTFIKPYFFCLLKLLRYECKISEIYVTYTEPLGYRKPLGERFLFTRGLDHVGEIPSFNGRTSIEKRNMLVILLGFEGDRALEVLRSVQPDKTVAINGFPAYRPEFKDVSLISNTSAIKEGRCLSEIKFSPANDPFETYRTIRKLYDVWSDSYNFSIAPLGTKPMALGACLFALEHPDVRILYAYPQGYIPKVAKGYGKTWMYEIFFE